MRMDGLSNIDCVCSHFNSKAYLANEVACMGADDTATNNAFAGRVKNKLGKALITTISDGSATGCPWEQAFFIGNTLCFALLLGKTGPRHLWIGIRYRRNLLGVKIGFLTGCCFCCNMAFVHCLMGKHGRACHITDGIKPGQTGASGGIGASIARALHAQGAAVALSGCGGTPPADSAGPTTPVTPTEATTATVTESTPAQSNSVVAVLKADGRFTTLLSAIEAAGLAVQQVNKVTEGRPHIVDMIKNGDIALVINTVEERRNAITDSRAIRTSALLARVTTFTTIAGAEAAVEGMKYLDQLDVISVQEMHAQL